MSSDYESFHYSDESSTFGTSVASRYIQEMRLNALRSGHMGPIHQAMGLPLDPSTGAGTASLPTHLPHYTPIGSK